MYAGLRLGFPNRNATRRLFHAWISCYRGSDGRTDRLQTDALCRIHAADDDATATQEDSFVVSGRVGMNLGITLSAYKFSVHV